MTSSPQQPSQIPETFADLHEALHFHGVETSAPFYTDDGQGNAYMGDEYGIAEAEELSANLGIIAANGVLRAVVGLKGKVRAHAYAFRDEDEISIALRPHRPLWPFNRNVARLAITFRDQTNEHPLGYELTVGRRVVSEDDARAVVASLLSGVK